MKRLGAIFCLFMMLYNIGGYYLLAKFVHRKLRREMHALIRQEQFRENLVLFKELKADFKKKTGKLAFINEKEFRFNGQMYDVVRIRETGNDVWLYCVNDTKEGRLLAQLKGLLDENANPQTKNCRQLLKGSLKEYISNDGSSVLTTFVVSFVWFQAYNPGKYTNWVQLKPVPPPQLHA